MLSYVNDNEIKIDYSGTNKKVAFPLNVIGASAGVDIDEADYTYTDDNTIFVDKTGDDGDAGTQAAPKLTILAGINACTVAKNRVVVLDSNRYDEDVSGYSNNYFAGLFSTTGENAILNQRSLSYTPDNDNSIFVDKDGDDGDAGTTAEPKLTIAGAIAACDATHQAVVIQDSGTYEEDSFEFTGNFLGLYGQIGCNPTVKINADGVDFFSDSLNISNLVELDAITAIDTDYIKFGIFSDDTFIVLWSDDTNDDIFYRVFNSDCQPLTDAVTFSTDSRCFDVAVFSDDTFILIYTKDFDMVGQIYNKDLTVSVEETVIYSFTTDYPQDWGITVLPDDKFLLGYRPYDVGAIYLKYYEKDFTFIDGVNAFAAPVTLNKPSMSLATLPGAGVDDVDIAVIAYKTSSNIVRVRCWECKSSSIDAAGSYGQAILLETSNTYTPTDVSVFSDNKFVVVTSEVETGDFLYFICELTKVLNVYGFNIETEGTYEGDGLISSESQRIASVQVDSYDNFICLGVRNNGGTAYLQNYALKKDGTEILTTNELINIGCVTCNMGIFSDDNIVVGFNDDSPDKYYIKSRMPYYIRGIIVSEDCVMEGITFNGDTLSNWSYFIQSTAGITMTNCTITDIYFPHYNAVGFDVIGFQIKSTDDIDIDKCIFKDSYGGVSVTGNNLFADDSIFLNISGGYGLLFAANYDEFWDSSVEHCSFQSCNGSIYFGHQNLTTDVICKNNCISGSSRYGIYSTNILTVTYCVSSDEFSDSVTRGTGSLFMNPLYIDIGDINDGNLNLKNKLIGYPVDSPAFNNSDDDRDCGAYDVNFVGVPPTWESITLTKENITPTLNPVGSVQTVNQDGSIGSTIKGWHEKVVLQWPTISLSEFNDILSLITSNVSKVRLYLEPTTNEYDYNVYNIVYDELDMGVEVYTASGTVRQNVKITLGKAYEYSS